MSTRKTKLSPDARKELERQRAERDALTYNLAEVRALKEHRLELNPTDIVEAAKKTMPPSHRHLLKSVAGFEITLLLTQLGAFYFLYSNIKWQDLPPPAHLGLLIPWGITLLLALLLAFIARTGETHF